MKAIAKYRDLISAGLALAFVIFVLGGVIANTVMHPASASHAEPAHTTEPAAASH